MADVFWMKRGMRFLFNSFEAIRAALNLLTESWFEVVSFRDFREMGCRVLALHMSQDKTSYLFIFWFNRATISSFPISFAYSMGDFSSPGVPLSIIQP